MAFASDPMQTRQRADAAGHVSEEDRVRISDAGDLGNAMKPMAKTVTKKDLVDRIAEQTGNKRVVVKRIIQRFLELIVDELGQGNRLEFRDFGVFEIRERAARIAQNPKTLARVHVPGKRAVKFKIGRLMKDRLHSRLSSIDSRVDLSTPLAAQGSP